MSSTVPNPGSRPTHDDFGGFQRDLAAVVDRRRALRVLGGLGLGGLLAACSSSSDGSAASTTSPAGGADAVASTTSSALPATDTSGSDSAPDSAGVEATAGDVIPDETGGPFPADGTNGPNVLTESGIERVDLTNSFGDLTGTADGIPVQFQLTVVNAADGSPLPGAAVYLWHCTADGRYSLYEIEDQNYLRGVQVADDAGRIEFTSVFPGCYGGRWPHAHFEVYTAIDEATSGRDAIKTSQLALPEADCSAVYADAAYGGSAENLARLSLDADNVFSDGWTDQLATVAGSTDDGYTASLLVRV